MKVVIVGGVAGGATAAARIRRLDEQAEIVAFERSGYISYANCGLPYYIGGVITDQAELTLQTPESFWQRFRVDMRVRHEVIAIHPERKAVSVRNLSTGETFEESYDKLLLSPGAKPTQPELPGVGQVFTLRTVEDTLRIHEFVKTHHPRSVVLAGGGFISLEMAENLRELGMEVTMVQRPKQLMNPFDPEMASFIHAKMRKKGVRLLLGHTVEGFEEAPGGVRVLLKGAEPLEAELVVLAIGVTPDTQLAKEAGLELGVKGSIAVNDRMETSVPDIYAVGDAVQVQHFVTGEHTLISLAGPANKQGRIAADNICGGNSRYQGSQGSSVVKVFDMTAAATGINEQAARKAGIECDKVYLSPASHAGYYPGGRLLNMKVLFEKNTYRLLGAQIVGSEGVDKRIDVLATAIRAGLTALDLKDLDLAYAPPYSSAKDPVNMAGFMIENLANGTVRQFHWDEVDALPRDGSVTLLDTRTAEEYQSGHIEGTIHIPVDELRERMNELETGKLVYVICQSGLRSYIACRILEQNGFACRNLAGGYRLYESVMLDRCAAEEAFPCGMDKR
ncbi:pyridine nucleotide-disulfide oxidoreductase family protein [Dysosmobacter sp. NSJ-60]|uniref:CoA-disulfide reductase n=1 Tax=Pusillibacter faecalis TaxID=2714358 RepID=A0A830QXH4_9FIRM|nr:FAD-dependent oxidoreductase [Pusillibacter faecalis]MBC5748197.1 pyridine nucleotide-disulfide oxidoreductase family protein [Dysosmobacter hominis]BCK86107.1 CoA-disulfide reductase [Pusillibacter faecalis]